MTELLLTAILFVQLYSFRVSRLHMERNKRWMDFNVASLRVMIGLNTDMDIEDAMYLNKLLDQV